MVDTGEGERESVAIRLEEMEAERSAVKKAIWELLPENVWVRFGLVDHEGAIDNALCDGSVNKFGWHSWETKRSDGCKRELMLARHGIKESGWLFMKNDSELDDNSLSENLKLAQHREGEATSCDTQLEKLKERIKEACSGRKLAYANIEAFFAKEEIDTTWMRLRNGAKVFFLSHDFLDVAMGCKCSPTYCGAVELSLIDGSFRTFLRGAEVHLANLPEKVVSVQELGLMLRHFECARICVGNGGRHVHYAQRHVGLSVSSSEEKKKRYLSNGNVLRPVVGGVFDSGNQDKLVRTIEGGADDTLIVRSLGCSFALPPGVPGNVCEACHKSNLLLNKKNSPHQASSRAPNSTATREDLIAKVEEQSRTIRNQMARMKRMMSKLQELQGDEKCGELLSGVEEIHQNTGDGVPSKRRKT